MKVKQKSIIASAIIYERGKGLEDGFMYGQFDHINGFYGMARDDPAALQIPYVYNDDISDDMLFIEEGDYIVTDDVGSKQVLTPDDFHSMYNVCENDECECPESRVAKHEQTIENVIHRLDSVEAKLSRLADMAQNAWSSLNDRL